MTDRQKDEWVHAWIDGRMGRQTDGWVDGCMDGYMNGCVDGQAGR